MNARRDTPRALWWLQHGATLWILFTINVALALALAGDTLLGAVACRCGVGNHAYVFVTPEGATFHDLDTCEGCWNSEPGHDNPVAGINHLPIHRTFGIGFDTILERGEMFSVFPIAGDPIPPSLEADARQASLNDSALIWLDTFKPGRTVTRSFLWSGLALNLGAVTLMSAFVYGFVTRGRRAVRLERLREGRCPVCRYSIRGLPTDTCPECGSTIEHPTAPA
ncbi:MAG: hypothetical protein ACIARR_09335 [Phycisphaerales bacterium JB059]